MTTVNHIKLFERIANILILLGAILILVFALLFQFVLHELPCPLCLLQRVGFIFIAFGFLMNLRFGFYPSHYSIILISGVFTSFVALRQIALHIVPGTGGYGSAVFGMHLYTWSFVATMGIVVASALILGLDTQFLRPKQQQVNMQWRFITNVLFILVSLVIVTNIISVIFQCGFKACPDNPVKYELGPVTK